MYDQTTFYTAQLQIDIVEIANDHRRATCATHFGPNWPNNVYQHSAFSLANNEPLGNDFHEYALEWTAKEIRM
jgi:hypothetical protein